MQSVRLRTGDEVRLPDGFEAAGVHCGVKPESRDLALFHSQVPAVIAGVFTTNRFAAPCVRECRRRLAGGLARAIVANSGNANACTGPAGERDAAEMASLTAERLGVPASQVFMSSTGPIGQPLPMEAIRRGIGRAADGLSAGGLGDAARALMTTDTRPKLASVRLDADGHLATIAGVAKGAGMIQPDMATMLAYVFTDATVNPAALHNALQEAVDQSFNRITVDGDQSTNDTVLALANGMAGNEPLYPGHPAWPAFTEGLGRVTLTLARMIVADGEGATRQVTIQVEEALSNEQALRVARAIGNSLLIKTSWAGGDPNWGRVLCAVGYAGVAVDPGRVDVFYDDAPAATRGVGAGTPPARLREIAARPAFTLRVVLHQGAGRAVMYACDTTEAYVRINVEE